MTKVQLQNLSEAVIAKIETSGSDGLSAYQIALDNGFVGTERQWLDSLRGDNGVGERGLQGESGNGFNITKVYGSLIELKADESNPSITEGDFVLINSEDEDNGSLYVKKGEVYMFQAKLAGLKGNRGEAGKRGVGVVVKGSKPTEGDLPLVGLEGDAYWVGERLYIWSNNPLEIVEPGFVRGNSLKGNPGSIGIRGEKGSDANVTSTNIKNALKYTPANQETTDTHASLDASKTTKGHMQVGEGLSVSKGVVRLEAKTDEGFDISAPASQYPLGVIELSIRTSNVSNNYVEIVNILNETMSLSIPLTSYFYRFNVKVIKRSNTTVRQEISVTSNSASSAGHEVFKLQRDTNYSSGSFYPWRLSVITMSGSGDPNNVLQAMRGSLYYDYASGKLYRKNTGTSDAPNTGWAVIAG